AIMAMYCDIEGGTGQSWFGNGCIDQDPLFENPENNNLLLSWTNYPVNDNTKSPCIDAGNPDSPPDPDGSVTDIGAYYFGAGLGMHDPSDIHSVQLYPNPAFNTLTIEMEMDDACTLEIYDLSGQKVILSKESSKYIQLDIRHLQPGMYLLKIIIQNKIVHTHKFIKQ
ncbi:MAG: T9SS type A sorting domain-containing protein, partial [Bacteroidales bacterium]|nr:T9SS type A sorting domain-containing protein [Bacteroidales bacterium]